MMTMVKGTTAPSPFPHGRAANSLDPIRIRMAREAAGLSKVELAAPLTSRLARSRTGRRMGLRPFRSLP